MSHNCIVDCVCYHEANRLIQLRCGNTRWLLSLTQIECGNTRWLLFFSLGVSVLKGDTSDSRARSLSFLYKQVPLGVALDFLVCVTQSSSLEWEPGDTRFKLVEPII